ncbi:uncharacterized protein M6B38_352230 [Iris pallida]|uniref:Uncharacterized protein n=1 Tax=Iris pallida TaxID=29817 RepID=A0AAX6GQG5_IRIPA|nr:uncharacterized protein M6B38_352230 [Iris pallida]
MRPDRSDAHLPAEEQAKIEEEARNYFRRITPMRHTKPSRSEYSSDYWDHLASSSDQYSSSPEFHKLQNLLQANPQKLVCDGSEVVDEYVETDYYKDLNRIDKQHHTTGTGFIKVEKPSDQYFDSALASDASPYGPPCRGNPATNEWIPSADPVVPVSHKPNRSDI